MFKIKCEALHPPHNAFLQREDLNMPRDQNLLIVIADGEHARFVRPAGDNALRSESLVESPEVHKQSADLGSDHPGASVHTRSSAHHALVPRHDLHALAKAKFAHSIARQLNAAAAGGTFAELVLVAPSHVLNALRAALDATAEAKVVGTLAKDLVKIPNDELWPHVRTWARPVHRSVM